MTSKVTNVPAVSRKQFVMAMSIMVLVAGTLFTLTSHAQQVFRVVGPNGSVSFSDTAPQTSNASLLNTGSAGSKSTSSTSNLPYELGQVAKKFPVVLYTGVDCLPCSAARSMLAGRGVPFTEKNISSNEDIQALQRLSGDNKLPFGSIGKEQLKGFSSTEWTQLLNAAGYPMTSVLPTSYRMPLAMPLGPSALAVEPLPAVMETRTSGSGIATPTVQPNAKPNDIQF